MGRSTPQQHVHDHNFDSMNSSVHSDIQMVHSANPFNNIRISRKLVAVFLLIVVLTASVLMLGHMLVLYTSQLQALVHQSSNEVGVLRVSYSTKFEEMVIGQRAVADNSVIFNLMIRSYNGQQISRADYELASTTLASVTNFSQTDILTVVGANGVVLASANNFHTFNATYDPRGLVTELLEHSYSQVGAAKGFAYTIFTSEERDGQYMYDLNSMLWCESIMTICDDTPLISTRQFAQQGTVVRYVATPIMSGSKVVGVMISADIINTRYDLLETTINTLKTGYVAIYRKGSEGNYTFLTSLERINSETGELLYGSQLVDTTLLDAAQSKFSTWNGTVNNHGSYDADSLLASGLLKTTSNLQYMVTVLPLVNRDKILIGFLVRGADTSKSDTLMQTSATYEIICLIPVIIVDIIIAVVLGRALSGPIGHLTEAAIHFSNVQTGATESPTIDNVIELPVKSKDEIGMLTHVFNIMSRKINATLRQVIKEKLKERAILEAVPDGVVTMRESGEILACNSSFKFMFGLVRQSPVDEQPITARQVASNELSRSEAEFSAVGTNLISYIDRQSGSNRQSTAVTPITAADPNTPVTYQRSGELQPTTSGDTGAFIGTDQLITHAEIPLVESRYNNEQLHISGNSNNNNSGAFRITVPSRVRPSAFVLHDLLQLDNHYAQIELMGLMRKETTPNTQLLDVDERTANDEAEEEINDRYVRFPILISHNETWFDDDKAYVLVIRDLRDRKKLEQSLKDERSRAEDLTHRMNAYSKLQSVLRTDRLRAAFKRFCQKLCNEENILYWEDIEKFKSLQIILKEKLTHAWAIYNRFIRRGSPNELNINEHDVSEVLHSLQTISEQLQHFNLHFSKNPHSATANSSANNLPPVSSATGSNSSLNASGTNLAENNNSEQQQQQQQRNSLEQTTTPTTTSAVAAVDLQHAAAEDNSTTTTASEASIAEELNGVFSDVSKSIHSLILDSFLQWLKTKEYQHLEKKFATRFNE